jgi:hypothetical protein
MTSGTLAVVWPEGKAVLFREPGNNAPVSTEKFSGRRPKMPARLRNRKTLDRCFLRLR